MALLEAKKLAKTFKMGETTVVALKGVDLAIDSGEFVAITGFSGSGKSTLMHLLGCLDTPTSGTYIIDDVDVSQAGHDKLAYIRNQKIGFIFQKFHLLPDLTALDNVALPRIFAEAPEAQAREDARKLLDMVGLGHRISHYPYQLSGGQQQRVAIARALINNPCIILADEPTGNLDSTSGSAILELFKKLNEQQGVTIIIVTHEHGIAAKTKRIIELVDGNIISDKKT